jgi:hypothetical protein
VLDGGAAFPCVWHASGLTRKSCFPIRMPRPRKRSMRDLGLRRTGVSVEPFDLYKALGRTTGKATIHWASYGGQSGIFVARTTSLWMRSWPQYSEVPDHLAGARLPAPAYRVVQKRGFHTSILPFPEFDLRIHVSARINPFRSCTNPIPPSNSRLRFAYWSEAPFWPLADVEPVGQPCWEIHSGVMSANLSVLRWVASHVREGSTLSCVQLLASASGSKATVAGAPGQLGESSSRLGGAVGDLKNVE